MSLEHKAIKASQIVMGLEESHLSECNGQKLHCDVIAPLQVLQQEAKKHGFDLQPISAFRSFDRQLAIWNAKACGDRPVLDCNSRPLNTQNLTDEQLMFAILRWSALPGASRHHWGTDFDIIDANALHSGYQVKLTVDETTGNGPFAQLHSWLTEYLKTQREFFRPYRMDTGGVAPEPWHLSYAPVARTLQKQLNVETLKAYLLVSNIALKDAVLNNIHQIFDQFVWVDWAKYPAEV